MLQVRSAYFLFFFSVHVTCRTKFAASHHRSLITFSLTSQSTDGQTSKLLDADNSMNVSIGDNVERHVVAQLNQFWFSVIDVFVFHRPEGSDQRHRRRYVRRHTYAISRRHPAAATNLTQLPRPDVVQSDMATNRICVWLLSYNRLL